MSVKLPSLPFAEFPLRPHRNGQWYKSVWNPRAKRSEQFYFGTWQDDLKGERALHDPVIGWLVRRSGIKAGTDNVRVTVPSNCVTLGELMASFLTSKRSQVTAKDLSPRTLGDYIQEIEKFVTFMKPATPVSGLGPAHFSAYMRHLVEERKLGRYARRRVRTYINTLLRHGVKNGWFASPSVGTEWVSPACDPESVRQAKLRAGVKDYSDRIISGRELNKLLRRSTIVFKAIILIGINAALGPADIGRLRWRHINLKTGKLKFPRPKTGVMRITYLWKKTRKALLNVREMNRDVAAIARDGEDALVFRTRRNLPFYREREVHEEVEVEGKKMKKLVRIAVENAVSITFRRMVKELELEGIHFYRLRHTAKTLAKRARDKEATDLLMGHRDPSIGARYDHEQVSWRRIKRVALTIHRRLWPRAKRKEDTQPQKGTMKTAGGDAEASVASQLPAAVARA